MNVLITGNLDDLRGDSAIYLLERSPSGSCTVYFSGTTGSLSSNQIINHASGIFTSSIGCMNWVESGDALIIKATDNSVPNFDLIIYHQYDYGDWQNITVGSSYAANKGIPIFTQHYKDSNQRFDSDNYYGFPTTFNIGYGNYLSGNSGSYGNQLEFYDSVIDSHAVTNNVLINGNNTGLPTTENNVYFDNYDVNSNQLNAVASVAAKYITIVNSLSASYSSNPNANNIYLNYIYSKSNFYYDIRQYLRKASSNYTSGWTPEQGYGIIQIQTATGSNSNMPNLL
jgi:hypothetical protein